MGKEIVLIIIETADQYQYDLCEVDQEGLEEIKDLIRKRKLNKGELTS